jgi:predicted branched-subunit amino acid permease
MPIGCAASGPGPWDRIAIYPIGLKFAWGLEDSLGPGPSSDERGMPMLEPAERREFFQGVRALLPILLGVVPFGLISGIAVVATGIAPTSGLVMSLLVFSGAALIVALQLISTGAPAVVVLFSALVVNLRFMIYSASLAPLFRHLSRGRKSLLGYLLSDQAYAASITHLRESGAPRAGWLHFLGAGITMWVAWQVSVGLGLFLGARLPASWSLEFTIPLTFLALAVPAIKDRFTAAAAALAGITAVLAGGAPFRTGLVLAALLGILLGTIWELKAA